MNPAANEVVLTDGHHLPADFKAWTYAHALTAYRALPLVVAASVKFQRDSNRAYLLVRDRIGATLSSLQEGLAGVRVIQAYGRERRQVRDFNRTSGLLYDAHMDSVRISAWYLPVIEGAGVLTTGATLAAGGWLVHDGRITIGTVTFFVLTLSNRTSFTQVIHLHGHCFRLLHALDDGWEPYWLDTVILNEKQTSRIAFVADNKGKWLIGSGVLERLDTGLSAWFEVT